MLQFHILLELEYKEKLAVTCLRLNKYEHPSLLGTSEETKFLVMGSTTQQLLQIFHFK